jgi:diguanylate cyclase (GGDEF)-like protein
MATTSNEDFLAAKLRELSERYAKTIPDKLASLDQALRACQADPLDLNKIKHLHAQLHTMAGSAGTFGFIVLGKSAAMIERGIVSLIESGQWTADRLLAVALKIDALLAWATVDPQNGPALDFEQDFSSSGFFESGFVSENTGMPEPRLVYLLEAQPPCNAYLVSELENFAYKVQVFSDLSALGEAARQHLPMVLIVDMGCQLDISQLSDLIPPQVLRICLADNGQFETRLAAVLAKASGYFVRPVNMVALAGRIEDMLRNEDKQPYRILIVDDDPCITDFYSAVLRSAGMEVVVLHDPGDIFNVLAEHRPDLLLMDVYMPKCSGPQLAQIVRQDTMYIDMPIVFLSTENNMGKQLDALSFGADDFLTKPMAAQYLVSSISSRVERYRTLRDLILRDSLTRLFNHSTIKEQAMLELERAKRHGKPMSVAMIDLDYFKNVNDNYGHSVGDNVIRSLAQLLQQLLRRLDIIGRYGGEEFAVVFPDTSASEARQALEKIRACFANIKHNSSDGHSSFNVTLSAGIVELHGQSDAKTLFEQADSALYEAKHSGRNRIVLFGDY